MNETSKLEALRGLLRITATANEIQDNHAVAAGLRKTESLLRAYNVLAEYVRHFPTCPRCPRFVHAARLDNRKPGDCDCGLHSAQRLVADILEGKVTA